MAACRVKTLKTQAKQKRTTNKYWSSSFVLAQRPALVKEPGIVSSSVLECSMIFTKVIFVIPDAPSTSSRCPIHLFPSIFATFRAQKPRFCARNARKRGFRKAKANKNRDFVLEMPENGGSGGQKRTKTAILCSGRWEGGIGNRTSGLPANHRTHFQNINT